MNEKDEKEKRFILWDPKDGFPTEGSSGILGRITINNVYLTTYAEYPCHKRPQDLLVGEAIRSVKFSLSFERGLYDIIRIK